MAKHRDRPDVALDDGDFNIILQFADSIVHRGRACEGKYVPAVPSTKRPQIAIDAENLSNYEIMRAILHELVEHYNCQGGLRMTHRAITAVSDSLARTLRNSPRLRRFIGRACKD